MNSEHKAKAWVDGKLIDVTFSYEMDGIKPLVYGVFDGETDVTEKIHPDEFDRIYLDICTDANSTRFEAADYAADLER